MNDPTRVPDEYRAPIQAPSRGGLDWVPKLPFVGSSPSYVNESDPSWEEAVAMVAIPGNPGAIQEAAGAWEVLFSRIEQARSMLDQTVSGVQGWQGAAADSYRSHLTAASNSMSQLIEQHRPVVQQLNTAADNLNRALETMPIPDDLVDDVMRARQSYASNGNLPGDFTPGSFFDKLFPIFHDRWLGQFGSFITFGFTDWVIRKLRDWLTDEDDKAKATYRQLAGEHVATMDSMPPGNQLLREDARMATVTPSQPPGANAPSAGPGGGNPGAYGTNLAGAGGGAMASPSTTPGVTGLATGGGGGAGGPTIGASAMPGSSSAAAAMRAAGGMGMAGMGAMGAGAAGARGGVGSGRVGGGAGPRAGGVPGMGGLAGGAGAGAGGRASGAGGRPGTGMAGIAPGAGAGGRAGGAGGRAGAMPGVGAVGAGAGGAGRAGAGAGGAGAGRGGAGVAGRVAGGAVPMGAAGAGAGAENATDHSTWLEEDEDVWGADSDAAPPVLGG